MTIPDLIERARYALARNPQAFEFWAMVYGWDVSVSELRSLINEAWKNGQISLSEALARMADMGAKRQA